MAPAAAHPMPMPAAAPAETCPLLLLLLQEHAVVVAAAVDVVLNAVTRANVGLFTVVKAKDVPVKLSEL